MRYFYAIRGTLCTEDSVRVPLDEPLNPLSIAFVKWQSAGGTIEDSEIILPEEQLQIFDEQITEFIVKKKIDGSVYFDEIEAKITKELFSMERTMLMALLVEMQSFLYPPLNLIRGGDFASALALFQITPDTENQIILNLWNETRLFVMDYYLTNYPR